MELEKIKRIQGEVLLVDEMSGDLKHQLKQGSDTDIAMAIHELIKAAEATRTAFIMK